MKQKDMEAMPINYDLLNLITPQGILLKNNKVELGGITHKLQYISSYPSVISVGWLRNLKEMRNTTVSLIVTPIEDVSAYVEGISKGITANKNIYNSTNNEALRTQAEFKIRSAEKIIRDITVNNIPYINLSLVTRTSGDTDNNFAESCRMVKNELAGMGLKARVPAFLQEQALRQSSPFDTYSKEILEISNKNMSLETLFLGLPFSGSGLVDEKGYFIGTDENGKIIVLSPFSKSIYRPNYNIVIAGSSGSGKSYLAKKIMLNEWLNGTKLYILDPEDEYIELCKKVEGKWVDCGGGKGDKVGRINPLQINPLTTLQEVNDEDDEYSSTKSALALHLNFLSTFFKLYYPEATTLEMSILIEIIEELYKDFDIDWETDVRKIDNKDFPIMEDLYKKLEKKSKENIEHRTEIETLRSIVRGMARGESSEIFNGHSNIKIDNSFVCFSISALENADKNIKAAQYLNILRLCENLAFRDRNEKVYVVCDEAYLLISKSHQGIEFLRNFCKRCRKRNSGLITITQNLIDFLAPDIKQYGQALLDNSTYKFFMRNRWTRFSRNCENI